MSNYYRDESTPDELGTVDTSRTRMGLPGLISLGVLVVLVIMGLWALNQPF